MAADKPADAFEDVFEEGEPQEAQTIHRIRANSTIMQLKKILGASWPQQDFVSLKDSPEQPIGLWTRLTMTFFHISRQSRRNS